MTATVIKGWCPGAHTPMRSGDGLILRIRPRLGRLSRDQALGLCALAERYGNGFITLTNRANLQIRGVTPEHYDDMLVHLTGLDLVDANPELEARRNLMLTPFRAPGDLAESLGEQLLKILPDLPDLPAKFGFSIDCGPVPVLARDPADIRIERSALGGLMLRADGCAAGRAATPDTAIALLAELARWFADRPDRKARRMVQAAGDLPASWQIVAPAPALPAPQPGPRPEGLLLGVPFGNLRAASLVHLLEASPAEQVVVTPWRMILLPGVSTYRATGFIDAPGAPLLRASACPGAPFCPAATVDTRDLATALACRIGGDIHVSGCAKGCANPRPAAITLVGRDGAFDLVKQGRSWDEPVRRGLTPRDLLTGSEPL